MSRFRCRMINIRPSRTVRGAARRGEYATNSAWSKSPPFAVNPRGVLTHRVRHVTTILYEGENHHYHADYLCGNGCNIDIDRIDEVLVDDPPKDRLLCDFCEDRARKLALPTGDNLAGRHIHRGVLVPRQVCCLPEAK